MTTKRHESRLTLLGVMASLCFFLNPLIVSLHLIGSEHLHAHGSESDDHSRGHAGHSHATWHGARSHGAHGGESAREGGSDGHEPHSSEDHLELLATAASMPSIVVAAVAPSTFEPALPVPPVQYQPLVDRAEAEPRPPPLSAVAAPRAPPIAS